MKNHNPIFQQDNNDYNILLVVNVTPHTTITMNVRLSVDIACLPTLFFESLFSEIQIIICKCVASQCANYRLPNMNA